MKHLLLILFFAPVVGFAQLKANATGSVTYGYLTGSITLDGTGSTDPNGYNDIVKFEWTQVSGPNQAAIAFPLTPKTLVANLAKGIYVFRLKVTDRGGLSDTDDMKVTIKVKGKG